MEAKTRKSEMTRAAIVDAALRIATESGLGAVTMKSVATRLQLSKSGVFSRAGSSESLRMAVIDEYGRRFLADVFLPAMEKPRGLPRLNAIVERWFERLANTNSVGASIYEATAFSLDLANENLSQVIRERVLDWRVLVRRTLLQAVEERQLAPDTDVEVVLYAIHALVLEGLYDRAFLGDVNSPSRGWKAYQRMIQSYALPPDQG
nr:TetR/AcrR family transcriptional regulator [uncultured Rhodoferax sp.]